LRTVSRDFFWQPRKHKHFSTVKGRQENAEGSCHVATVINQRLPVEHAWFDGGDPFWGLLHRTDPGTAVDRRANGDLNRSKFHLAKRSRVVMALGKERYVLARNINYLNYLSLRFEYCYNPPRLVRVSSKGYLNPRVCIAAS